jgi:hypothetical protein
MWEHNHVGDLHVVTLKRITNMKMTWRDRTGRDQFDKRYITVAILKKRHYHPFPSHFPLPSPAPHLQDIHPNNTQRRSPPPPKRRSRARRGRNCLSARVLFTRPRGENKLHRDDSVPRRYGEAPAAARGLFQGVCGGVASEAE